MNRHAVRFCRHESTMDIPGKQRTYGNLKARVLEVGGFSIFDATANPRDAWKFDHLLRDTELTVTRAEFPWMRVEKRR